MQTHGQGNAKGDKSDGKFECVFHHGAEHRTGRTEALYDAAATAPRELKMAEAEIGRIEDTIATA